MNIKIESPTFTTLADAKRETRNIKNQIAEQLGLSRDEFRLSNGLIVLRGYSKHTDTWFNLTDVIGVFPKYIKSGDYNEYKLYCHVQTK